VRTHILAPVSAVSKRTRPLRGLVGSWESLASTFAKATVDKTLAPGTHFVRREKTSAFPYKA